MSAAIRFSRDTSEELRDRHEEAIPVCCPKCLCRDPEEVDIYVFPELVLLGAPRHLTWTIACLPCDAIFFGGTNPSFFSGGSEEVEQDDDEVALD